MKSNYNYYEFRLPTGLDTLLSTPPIKGLSDSRRSYPWYLKVKFVDGFRTGKSVHQGIFSADILSTTVYWWTKHEPSNIPILVKKGSEYVVR